MRLDPYRRVTGRSLACVLALFCQDARSGEIDESSSPAIAAQQVAAAPARDEQTLPEVRVPAQRERVYRPETSSTATISETPIKDTPFSVQVIPREILEDRGVVNLNEALTYTPGVSRQVGFGGLTTNFRIRGGFIPLYPAAPRAVLATLGVKL